ncbi:MAG TPA: FeoA family protein [Flavobacteriales bacterium]|nr:FeoA family protein [Flavobacteriales bacterium]
MEKERSEQFGLDELPQDRWASGTEVAVPANPADRGLVLRLMEIGFVPGERVRVVSEGHPGREPLAVRVGRTTFALRRREAAFIQVIPVE